MRFLKLLIVMMIVIAGFSNSAVLAEEDGDFTYEVSDGKAVITGYSGDQNHLYIPDEISGYPVREIASEAIDCSYVTRLEIPSSVRKIQQGAFYNCQSITVLSFPNSTDGSYGFDKMVSLEKLIITNGTGESFDYATASATPWYQSCRNIYEVVLDDRISVIGDYMLEGLLNVSHVTMPSRLRQVGRRSFYNWLSLQNLQLPVSLQIIGKEAFGCDPIVRYDRSVIVLPQNIIKIDDDAFDFNNIYYTYKGSEADKYLKDRHIIHKIIDLGIPDSMATLELGDSGMFVPSRIPDFMKEDVVISCDNNDVLELKEDGYYVAHRKGTVTLTISTESGSVSRNITVRTDEKTDTYYLRVPVESFCHLMGQDHFDRLTSSNLEDVTYQCEDEKVTILEDGLMRIAEPGRYRINVLLNDRRIGLYLIDAYKAVERIEPGMDSFVMTVDNRYKFVSDVYPEDADDKTLYYFSEDDSVVTTNLTGSLLATGKGETFINIFSRDNNAVARVRVKVLDDSMNVPVSAFPLMIGKSFDLNIDGNDLTYYSSDDSIATVSSSGIVTGISTGNCYITVGNDDAARTIDVAVYEATGYGVDLSEWNNYISEDNFVQMKRSGIEFVILRAGYSDDYEDYMFENNYYNAKEAGLDVGVYHYITALDAEQAVVEAESMLAWIEGKQFEYPVILDIEEEEHRSMSSANFNAIVDAYCSTIEEAGYKSMIYSFASLLTRCSSDNLSKYDIWQAHWGVTYPSVFTSRYTMWQFTSEGKVPGVKGNVDMNISFYDYPTYIKENHLNGY